MVRAIVFEKNGEIRLATLVDESKHVSRENLKDFIPCPEEILALVPKDLVEFCQETATQYLYLNAEGQWESTTDSFSV